jgi:hypothetical protein
MLSLRSPEAQVSSTDKGVPPAWVKGTEPLPAGSESQGDILAGLDNSREEQEVEELASPRKMHEEYYDSLSSDDQLSNTGFLGRVGTQRDCLTSRRDHGELLDRVECTQRRMFETMDGNHLTSIESSNSLGWKLDTVSDLLRVLIGEVARGNRAMSSYKKLGAAPGKGETRSSTKSVKCFNCKKMGHYSSDCPKRSTAVGLIGDGTNMEQAFGAEDAAEETASEAEYASAEEQSQEEEQTCDGNTADAHEDCDEVSLNDWCGHVRAVEDSDSEDE